MDERPTSHMGSADRSFLSHAKVISALTLLSRVFGLLRETAVSTFFGTSLVAGAQDFAFAVPNLFRKLFGEGALSAAFIPLYSKSLKQDAPEEARAFAASSVNFLIVTLLAITLLGELVIGGLYFFWTPNRLDFYLILRLSAIMLPYVVLICATAFLSAILQVHRRFAMPAFVPVLLNIIHIGVTVFGGILLGINIHSPAPDLARQTTLATWLAVFVLVAGLAQIAALVPDLRAIGFRFSFGHKIWTPGVKRMVKMSIPVAIAASVLQISVLMDKSIAMALAQSLDTNEQPLTHFSLFGHTIPYPMEIGAIRRLNWAQLLYQFPLGIFAIAIATAIFPSLSSDALEKDRSRFNEAIKTGLQATLIEGIAASVGLIIVRYQILRLFVRWGQVTEHDIALAATSLAVYASAVWAYSIQQIINRAYYALHDTRTPLYWAIGNIAINLVVEIPLLWVIGEAGMAAGTAASFAVQSLVMLCVLRKRIGDLGLRDIVGVAGRLLVAGGAMYGACTAVQWLPLFPQGSGKAASLLQLLILVGVGAAVYLGVCQLLGIRTLQMLFPRKSTPAR